jgi:hypothetical protein
MTDFVMAHPDGLATYRLYRKCVNPRTGKLDVDSGESLDVPSGPPRHVMMWRRFSKYCRSIEQEGWHSLNSHANELTSVALYTKQILRTFDQCVVENKLNEYMPVEGVEIE